MKFKTTKRAIMNNYAFVICVCYADLQYLLNYRSPIAYSSGVYGWNADIYDISDITGYNACICTGYRPYGNINSDYSYNADFETRAEKIVCSQDIDYNEKPKMLENMIKDFALPYIEKYKEKHS